MSATLDLRQLAAPRAPDRPSLAPPRPRWLLRYGLPLAALGSFAAMVGWASRDQWRSETPVRVAPVMTLRAEGRSAGAPLFQAPAWIEPRPAPVVVTALAEGVVEAVLVVEGQDVVAGQPLARLIDADARLALAAADAVIERRRAEVTVAQAELDASRTRLAQPVHLDAALAEVVGTLARAEGERAQLRAQLASAAAEREFAQHDLQGKTESGTAIPERVLQKSKAALGQAQAQFEELTKRIPLLEQEIDAHRRKRAAMETQRSLLVEEKRAAEQAEGRLRLAEAELKSATVARDEAKLRLDRMVVPAPISGRVLQKVARPGSRLMGLAPQGHAEASTIVTLYDPERLQARADVRLEDVPMVEPGAPVRLETPSSKEPLRGTVLATTSFANIQKNTLEIKIALDSPPASVRPEMLTTATFMAPERRFSKTTETPPRRLMIPRELTQGASSGEVTLWIVDSERIARKASVKLGTAVSGGLVEAASGLQPTDRIVVSGGEGLREGARVRIESEDDSFGAETTAVAPPAAEHGAHN